MLRAMTHTLQCGTPALEGMLQEQARLSRFEQKHGIHSDEWLLWTSNGMMTFITVFMTRVQIPRAAPRCTAGDDTRKTTRKILAEHVTDANDEFPVQAESVDFSLAP